MLNVMSCLGLWMSGGSKPSIAAPSTFAVDYCVQVIEIQHCYHIRHPFYLIMSSPTDGISRPDGPPKRKRDEDARRIIDDFQRRRECRDMSPETERIGNVFFNMANRSIVHSDIDQQLLFAGWESFVKAADQARVARAVREDCNQKIARLEKQLEDSKAAEANARARVEKAKAEIDAAKSDAEKARFENTEATSRIKDIEFLFEVGDWTAMVLKEIKLVEGEARQDGLSVVRQIYRDSGLSAADAQRKATADASWSAMKGRMTTDTHECVVEERERLEKWGRTASRMMPYPGPHTWIALSSFASVRI